MTNLIWVNFSDSGATNVIHCGGCQVPEADVSVAGCATYQAQGDYW